MKLQLSQESGINIVTVSDGLDLHSFNVLKAGVTKLFRDGKNKIIIHLVGIDHLPADVIREVAILDLTAKELSGRIAASGVTDSLKQEILAFAKPPVLPIFPSIERAVEFFQRTTAALSGDDFSVLKEENNRLQSEIEELKKQIAAIPVGEIDALRGANKEYSLKNENLLQELNQLMQERRRFASAAALAEQIQVLEETIKALTDAKHPAKPTENKP